MNRTTLKAVHLIGAGGINMSADGKLLLASGITVTGSDMEENEQTKLLAERGARIMIGEAADNIPEKTDLVVYTSAAPATNLERIEATKRDIPQMTNFAFLGQWFEDAKTIVISGTHGKSTTTAMLGLILEKAGLDPTVVVGSKVPAFVDGNLRMGREDLFVVEGDEYARHFLEFHPFGLIINNLELDHTDVFRDIEALLQSFHELVGQVKERGFVVVNVSDPRLSRLIETERPSLEARGVTIVPFGSEEGKGVWHVTSRQDGDYRVVMLAKDAMTARFNLQVPGHFNAMNASGAALMAKSLGVAYQDMGHALESFKGIWRRFEFLGEQEESRIYSDYGHHPTAVCETLKAAHESFPGRKVLLCFQPHHRNRTKALYQEFIPCFDATDGLVICEIYEVAGRDATEDADVSSRKLVEDVTKHDAERSVTRIVAYAPDPPSAVKKILEMAGADDIVIVMGAGDIDAAIRAVIV
ncbi:UDP-N-acetylmuramate--L-alanine ligase [Patescibacteria group bacterium]|nr:UDP-N-acetylmuramate--L-alanine ligase [Patescibacteria group bacterium]